MQSAQHSPRVILVVVYVFAAAAALVLMVGGLSFWSEYACYRPFRKAAPSAEMREKLPKVEDVLWQVGATAIRGWFIAGTNRATVILLHGTGATRADLVKEHVIFHSAGFNVLSFDWPGHGESDGQSDWGPNNVRALSGALDWLARRPEVDMGRVGAWGVSMGTMPLLAHAARDSRLQATAVAGAFGDLREQLAWEYRSRGGIGKWGAILGAALRGTPIGEALPRDLIGRLSPRPVLVILGEGDGVVPPQMTRNLYDSAKTPKQLLALPNVGHGEYSDAAGSYSEPLVAFFERYLNQARVGGSR